MIHITLLGWNDLEATRKIHTIFEVSAIVLFALLVLFEIFAHNSPGKSKREHVFKVLGLWSFALAIISEVLAFPYSRRLEKLFDDRTKITESAIAQISNNVAEIDLAKKPIATASATAILNINGPIKIGRFDPKRQIMADFARLSSDPALTNKPTPSFLIVHGVPTIQLRCTDCEGLEPGATNVSPMLFLEFDLKPFDEAALIKGPTGPISEWSAAAISMPIGGGYELREGFIRLKINSDLKTFSIPSQKVTNGGIFAYDTTNPVWKGWRW